MQFAFFLVSFLMMACCVAVVSLKNPIHSALALVGNLFMVAVMFALLDAHFLAAVQVIVYAGAIMVLVLFMLMLLNVKVERRTRTEVVLTLAAIVVGIGFLGALIPLVHSAFKDVPEGGGKVLGTVHNMGLKLFHDYVFLFQASGILLMVAIVGAIMLAKVQYKKGTT